MKWSYPYLAFLYITHLLTGFTLLCIIQEWTPLSIGISSTISTLFGFKEFLIIPILLITIIILIQWYGAFELICIRNGSYLIYKEPGRSTHNVKRFINPLNGKEICIRVSGSFTQGTMYRLNRGVLEETHKTILDVIYHHENKLA